MDLVDMIYVVTRKFPDSEKFGLMSQMRRSAVSIPSNVAEGFLRGTTKDYRRFIRMAFASGGELDTQLQITLRQKFISPDEHNSANDLLIEVMKMLNVLQRKLIPNS